MRVVYPGLNKAFGAIPHSILLEKLLLMVWMGALFSGYKTMGLGPEGGGEWNDIWLVVVMSSAPQGCHRAGCV